MKTTEHQHAKKFIQWARANERKYPGLDLLFAVPNGGKRNVVVALKLKAEGVKAGVPDYFLPVARGRYHGLFIELKAIGGKVSEPQRRWLKRLAAEDYAAGICFGADDAIAIIETYLR